MPFTSRQKTASLVLKCIVFVSAVTGTLMSAGAGRRAFMGGRHVFMYFTIQSNILIALLSVIGAFLLLRGRNIPHAWYVIKFVGTVAITLTGVVFCAVLAPVLGVKAWNVQNTLTHVIVPLAAIADFMLTGPHGDVAVREIPWVTLPPLFYAVYAGIGYLRGWEFAPGVNYPYFFLNWGSRAGAFGFSKELPFMGPFWWILLLCVFLLAVGRLYLAAVNKLKKRLR